MIPFQPSLTCSPDSLMPCAYGLASYGRPPYSASTPVMQAEQQAALTALGQQALSGADLPTLFQATVDLVRQVLQLPYSQVWQTLSDGSTLQSMASVGWEPEARFRFQKRLELLPPGELVFVDHFAEDLSALGQNRPDWMPTDCASSIQLLIPGQTKPLGLLCAYATRPYDFTADDIHFLQVVTHVLAAAIERKRSEALLQTQTHILESIAAGSDLQSVFNDLCLLIEQQSPGALCSLLLLDQDAGRMRAGAAPSFSKEVADALDGLLVGEGMGSCGTAACRGEAVFVSDVATDPVWAQCRDFALQHDIYACWSLPFCSQSGDVLGTFALSHAIPCEPTAHHLDMMRTATHLASIAVEGHRVAEQLKQQARYDALTGLPNRTLFLEKLQNLFRLPMQQRSQFAVLFLDVDQFKLINDSLGHTVGDQLLVELARRLQSGLGPNETFARLGGDEFAILLALETPGDAQALAHQLQTALATPLKLQAHEIFASISIGIAHFANHYGYAEELLRDADTAMYRAKSLGRERSVIFEHTMHTQTVARLQLEIDLRRAVEELVMQRSQFQLYYQPIVAIPTQKIVGFEALVRWQHPERGLVSPLEFIPIAEETGLIGPIGHWVLQEACQQLRQWHQTFGSAHLTMNVNVSSCQFLQPNFVAHVQEILHQTQIAPTCLKLEITESVLMEASAAVVAQLDQLQKLKIRLSLDDFGTGYSALSYLHRFPIQTLKIDRSFVQNLGQSAKGQDKLVQTIAALAHGLEMDTVAEGVETPAQLAYLSNLGCEYYQGYLFSPPLLATAVEQLYAQNSGAFNSVAAI